MATHGNVGEFKHGAEDWTAYCERLEQYFTANDVDDAGKQRAILLSGCGAATYQRSPVIMWPCHQDPHSS